MAIDKSDLEAIKAAIISAINKAGGAQSPGDVIPDENIAKLDAYIGKLENTEKALQRQKQAADQLGDSSKKLNEINRISIEQAKTDIELAQIRYERSKAAGEATDEDLKQLEQLIQTRQKEINDIELTIEQTKELIKARKEEEAAIESIKGKMAGLTEVYGKHQFLNIGNITSMVELLSKTNALKAGFAVLAGAAIGLTNTMISLVFQLDEASKGFMATTGASQTMAKSIMEDRQRMQELGVSIDGVYEAHIALRSEMTEFSMMSSQMQRDVANTGALLELQGVSLSDYAKATQMGVKAFGMSGREAAGASRELNSLARQIGVTPQQMAQDFASSSEQLAAFGSTGVKAFKDMALVSKTTGLEIDKLLRISEGFDTFEGAATQAGKLNAALGGNFVNALDLMMAKEPAKRFEMIRDAVLRTGKTFDDMDYFERKFYVGAIDGIETTADLALLMSGDLDKLNDSSKETTASIKALEERTRAFQSIQDRLRNVFAAMIPTLNKVLDQLDIWIKQLDQGRGPLHTIKVGVESFISVLMHLIDNIKFYGTLAAIWFLGKKGLAVIQFFTKSKKAGDSMAKTILKVGQAANRTSKGIMALGAAAALAGVGIGIAAAGVGQLVAAFGQAGENAMEAVLGIAAFTAGFAVAMLIMAKLTPATTLATLGILAFGAATVMLGFGIKLAAEGIAEMATGFASMFNSLTAENTTLFTEFVATIVAGSAGFATAGAGLGIMSLGIASIGRALDGMPIETLKELSKLGGIGVNVETSGAAQNIQTIMDEINKVDTLKLASAGLLVTAAAATAGAGGAAPAAAAPIVKQEAPKVDVKVYIDGKQMKAEALIHMSDELGRRVTGR